MGVSGTEMGLELEWTGGLEGGRLLSNYERCELSYNGKKIIHIVVLTAFKYACPAFVCLHSARNGRLGQMVQRAGARRDF